MLFMASSLGVAVQTLAARSNEVTVWDAIYEHLEHTSWVGCSPWDLIQPSFMFIVGAAMPFSYANRRLRGEPWRAQFRHALWRSVILVLLGVFLASNGSPRTNFTFTNVLSQIGLGYTFVFLLLGSRMRIQLVAVVLILLLDWALFAVYPVPKTIDLPGELTLPADWRYMTGFYEHWEKHVNVAAMFDRWFLNLFPRNQYFFVNDGGYTTLNFIPSIATMLIGVIAGEWLQSSHSGGRKILVLFLVGSGCLIVGQALGDSVCPIVKRIWTPSWVIYSASWSIWLLAVFYGLIDVARWKRWAFPFVVVGMNSLAMYFMAQLTRGWTRNSLATHLSTLSEWSNDWIGALVPREIFGGTYGPIVAACTVLFAWWLVCYWMYLRGFFIRI